MKFTVDELLAWASQHEHDDWATLVRRIPFRYHVTGPGIEYIPSSGTPRNVPHSELASFCDEVQESGSFSPGKYPDRWHKSYSLPLIQRFLQARGQRS
ncbi:MAG TPA: hypothetical protein VF746_11640 [Longimicrobium sp.]|jgi:hypothetical protein